ncbi:hypothetical protein SAMN02787144_101047 [Streptomyces atratus]|uniref:Uncharacterized protein n=1 Tax=Streptomyces atratus TaxID=1893 RepID=A0A1K2C4Q1_STRAR|nr:hypothetical protein SAMN02787144_101047 [Streptomyces atratus]
MRRDRLEMLTALINGPEFDPALRGGVLKIPPTHPVYPWNCTVVDCARPRWRRYAMCSVHAEQWQEAEARGMSRAQFLRTAPRSHTSLTIESAREHARASDLENRCHHGPQRTRWTLHRLGAWPTRFR